MSSVALSAPVSPASQASNNEYNTDIQTASSIGRVPKEIITEIFKFLSPEELAKACRVCKKWNELGCNPSLWSAFDLKKLFPALKILDEKIWQKYADLSALGLSVNDTTPSDNRKIIPKLKRLFAFLKIERGAGITLLTMPEGLSKEKLEEFAQSPKEGNPTRFRANIWHSIDEREHEDITVDKTYRIAITNSVLEGSRNLSAIAQQELVNKIGCEMPKLLEVSTLAILTYISSPKSSPVRLYSDNPWTYTRCSEQNDGCNMIVGGFTPTSLAIGNDDYYGFCCDEYGIGVVQKF